MVNEFQMFGSRKVAFAKSVKWWVGKCIFVNSVFIRIIYN